MKSNNRITNNTRPKTDALLADIADYVCDFTNNSTEALDTARYCLMDTLACALMALSYPSCTKLLGPIVHGATLSGGARVPGTEYELDPVQAAFNIGVMIRWLDFNDTWLAAEWGHPSDNLGAILAVADYLDRNKLTKDKTPILIGDLLSSMIKSYEIQGILALENSFNQIGLDHVLLVRVASTAVITQLLGGNREQIINAISNAWMDGGALRAYRHVPNTGTRKSWAAGDATSRAVQLALMSIKGEMGYPSVLSAQTWGFYDVLFEGKSFKLQQNFGCYVMENILFKIAYPAEFHAQTAVEAAIQLHPQVENRFSEISHVQIETQQAAMRIIDKTGKLYNPADRDHCLQYMVAVSLLSGNLIADDYEDDLATDDSRIDELRAKIQVKENKQFSLDYLDPEKRSIANSVQVFFKDRTSTTKVKVEFPLGHRSRRKEAIPILKTKFESAVTAQLKPDKASKLIQLLEDEQVLMQTPVNQMMDLLSLASVSASTAISKFDK